MHDDEYWSEFFREARSAFRSGIILILCGFLGFFLFVHCAYADELPPEEIAPGAHETVDSGDLQNNGENGPAAPQIDENIEELEGENLQEGEELPPEDLPPEEEAEPEYIPPVHELIEELFGGGGGGLIAPASIGTQVNYPYTGGGFMAVNTNYGNGLLIVPEQYKVNTFGFVKNSNRVVNLTNGTVNAYFIMGGTTYSARFQRYGEAEYQYTSGSTTTWRALTVSALTDTNIQYLDETGERGIQRPYLSLESKILLAFVVMEVVIHAVGLMRRR